MNRARDPRGVAGARRGEAGFVAGGETLAFGVLVFVVGILLVVNAWAVVDARFAVDAAATEAVRAYAEGSSAEAAGTIARARALAALDAYGRDDSGRVTVSAPELAGATFGRCVRVRVTVSYRVPALTMPFVGSFGPGVSVQATASELVDPYRDGLEERPCTNP